MTPADYSCSNPLERISQKNYLRITEPFFDWVETENADEKKLLGWTSSGLGRNVVYTCVVSQSDLHHTSIIVNNITGKLINQFTRTRRKILCHL